MFFEYPELLWLEIVPFLLVLHYLYIELMSRRPHLRVSVMLPWTKGGFSAAALLRHVPFALKILALVMIVIAMARPRSSDKIDKVDSEGIDIMLTMDVSTSMLARDFVPDRISAAKDIAIEFISQRPYDRMGIVVFAGESYTQCPLTTDRSTLINLMKEVQTDLIEDGTAIGNDIYITGGMTETDRNSLYRISALLSGKWEKLTSYPGNKRIQSIFLSNGKNELYLIGGFQSSSKKKDAVLSDDILCYNVDKRSWKRLIDLPLDGNGEKRCLVGGSGIVHNDMLILTGGVNYTVFKNAINGKAPEGYLEKPVEWYKFNDDVLFFNLKERTWNVVKEVDGAAKAGGVLLMYEDCLYMICGETKPGIRTNKIITIPLF